MYRGGAVTYHDSLGGASSCVDALEPHLASNTLTLPVLRSMLHKTYITPIPNQSYA